MTKGSIPLIDPVCGMTVDARSPKGGRHTHQNVTYGFCSVRCLIRFKQNPALFLDTKPPASESSASGLYTCPMHPEVQQVGAGPCPLCGMALEPLDVINAPDDSELTDFSRRLFISLAFFVPLMLLSMRMHQMPHLHAIQLAFSLPILWAGKPIFKRFAMSIKNRSLNMFSLIGLGTVAAFTYSVLVFLLPSRFPPGVYFEAASAIVTFVLLGQVLELRARRQTSSALRALLDLAPKMARKITSEGEQDVSIALIQVGDKLRVRPGESIPTDGIVLEGKGLVDESMLSGEAVPVTKETGSLVTGGTLNNSGSFIMEVRQVGEETALAHIVRLVAQAQRSRAPIQQVADRVAAVFVPAVIATAIVTALVWGLWGPEPRLTHALVNAVAVLIIACPCALGLATPMSIMVGIGKASQNGVLVRDAASLQAFEAVDVLLLDKTGTLTEGHPHVSSTLVLPGFEEKQIIAWAAALERASEHPLAFALLHEAERLRQPLTALSSFETYPGQGVSGIVEGKRIRIGSAAYLESLSIDLEKLLPNAESRRARGETILFMSVDNGPAALLGISDPLKPQAKEVITALQQEGLRVIMLSGDHEITAKAIAKELGLNEVFGNMAPKDKIAAVKSLQDKGHRVAMAGDGINDAPALAQAQVGLAMATGTDIAIESAGITLMSGSLQGLMKARKLSRAVMRNIRQNLFFAFIYNLVGVPVAAGLLYPFFGVLLTPMMGAIAMSLSSVSVITNALRLRRVRL